MLSSAQTKPSTKVKELFLFVRIFLTRCLVKNTAEATLDSSVLLQLTASHAQMARSLKSGSGAFDIDDYIAKLVTFMGGRRLDGQNPEDSDADDALLDTPLEWEQIGRRALAKSRRVPVVGFM